MIKKYMQYAFIVALAFCKVGAATSTPPGGDLRPQFEAFNALPTTAQKISACNDINPKSWSMEDLMKLGFYFQSVPEMQLIAAYIRSHPAHLAPLKANIQRFIEECEELISKCYGSLAHEHDFCSNGCIFFQQALTWLNTLG